MNQIFIKTLGCKVNSYDSHALENQFRAQGFAISEAQTDADITVINTCSVTANAEKEARYLARRFKRENPETFVVLTGCYAQVDSANLAELADVDFVVPNEVKEQAAAFIKQSFAKRGEPGRLKIPEGLRAVKDNRQAHFKSSLTLFDHAESSQTRVFLKIQDGCDGFCTYCLIPYARGASRSVAPDQIVAEVKRQIALGVREIVFTGIHIGDYGRDLKLYAGNDTPVVSLLADVLALPGAWRLRISSLEPSELTEPLLQLMAKNQARFCDHFHLPLQSGSDRILKLMRRTYTRAEYANAVRLARRYFPNASIGADVIPGFPGETQEDHAATINLVEELKIAYLHVFPYSKRPNTAAVRMPGHLDASIVKARAAELRALSTAHRKAYLDGYLGQSAMVLWENDHDKNGRLKGHTANYIDVVATPSETVKPGLESLVTLMGFTEQATLLAKPLGA